MTQTWKWFGRRDPDSRGYYGEFGGRFVPETLVAPIEALEREYLAARQDPEFVADANDHATLGCAVQLGNGQGIHLSGSSELPALFDGVLTRAARDRALDQRDGVQPDAP